jgi:gliding motility-associated-like protein
MSACLPAQECTGTLGENIFEEGDFGSGQATILTPDPGIAPGFIYETNPPPQDGFYTITNNMNNWSASPFFGWDAFSDNSNDPNGYMMVVNAAVAPGKFYEQQVDDLCENTLYQFSADIRNILLPGTNLIAPNVSFSIDGTTQFTSGAIPENRRWNNYGFTFTTAPGQTSVLLALSNNAPGGGGNDLAIDNLSFRACGPLALISGAEMIDVCSGDGGSVLLTSDIIGNQYADPQLQWQQSSDGGATWQDLAGENGTAFLHPESPAGQYYYRYLLANGMPNLTNANCRVVSNVKIINVAALNFEIVDTICEGSFFEVGEQAYGTSGVTIDTLRSSINCDSIVTLRLTVEPDPSLVDIVPIVLEEELSCEGLRCVLDLALSAAFDEIKVSLYEDDPLGTEILVAEFVSTTDTIELNKPGSGQEYRVEVTYKNCGQVEYPLGLAPEAPRFQPILDVTADGRICDGKEIILEVFSGPDDAFEVASVRYADGNTDNPRTLPVMLDTDIPIIVFNECGDSTELVFTGPVAEFCTCEEGIPELITPNGDNVNDVFRLYTICQAEDYTLFIFNRWGQRVFESTNPDQAWDGTKDGTPQNSGLYLYKMVFRFSDSDEVKVREGSFNLIR